jgi:lipopolysaccharide transport system ATP-binding protein
MTAAISVENVSKAYRIGHLTNGGYRTLRESLTDSLAGIGRQIKRLARPSSAQVSGNVETFWALNDVSFAIQPGEAIGIIGRNGAGKSTLLKILSRITEPSSGRATIRGRLASLLEVGTGFHAELTGRENIYLNGSILGMSRREIHRKFDEIVAFSEVEQFLDTPVKRYSSGMYVRLAFAVAAHLEPELLLVDEVLAVGDAGFQRKCLGKMGEVSRQGRTILFVSHNMGAVGRLCSRAVWLEKGRVRQVGEVNRVVSEYLRTAADGRGELAFTGDESPGSEYVRLSAVRVRNQKGDVTNVLDIRYPFSIELAYRILRPTANLRLGLRVVASEGTVVFSTRDLDDGQEERIRQPGEYVSRCTIPGNFLDYGQYYVSFGADFPMRRSHFSLDQALAFQIEPTGGAGGHVPDGRSGLLRLRLPWSIEPLN